MNYKMEELVSIVGSLAETYTSKESSSITSWIWDCWKNSFAVWFQ